MKNRMGKSRKADNAYITFGSLDGSWTWKLLKSWQGDDGKAYARWFMDVSSPYTMGGSDMGDTYVYDVLVAARAGRASGTNDTASETTRAITSSQR